MRRGDRGAAVTELQTQILALGYDLVGGADGILGPSTYGAAIDYARSADLEWDADGSHEIPVPVVSAIQAAAVAIYDREHLAEHPPPLGVGTWCVPWLAAETATEARALGLSDLSVYVNALRTVQRRGIYVDSAALAAMDTVRDAGLRAHLTTWASPRPNSLAALAEAVPDILSAAPATLELDTEGPWRAAGWRGDHAEAARHYWGAIGEPLWEAGIPTAITDYASIQGVTRHLITEAPMRAAVILRPQLYSVSTTARAGKTAAGSVYWPGRTQRYGMSEGLWGQYAEQCAAVEIALAGYKQGWEHIGLSTTSAMNEAARSAVAMGTSRHWYWFGARQADGLRLPTGEVAGFIRRLCSTVSSEGAVA